MKRILILIAAIFFILNSSYAQSHMTIRKTDGTTISVPIAEVDSIYYEDIFTCGDILTDIDGNEYETVLIGNQCWTKTNMRAFHYSDGTEIPIIADETDWSNLGSNDRARCFYNNYVTGGNTYGVLYNFAAATNDEIYDSTSVVQGICPTGWHVPSTFEYNTLIDSLGGEAVAGGKMKEIGTTHWVDPNTGADNSSEFTALPGGFRLFNGTFHYLGEIATFWSSTEDPTNSAYAYYMTLHNDDSNANINNFHYFKKNGMSVRCIMN